jgi:hypothetical protein
MHRFRAGFFLFFFCFLQKHVDNPILTLLVKSKATCWSSWMTDTVYLSLPDDLGKPPENTIKDLPFSSFLIILGMALQAKGP